MFDDDARRRLELTHAFERSIAVRDVVVRQLLALNLPRLCNRGADGTRIRIERSLLMRVLAIAQVRTLAKRQVQIFRKSRCDAADGAGEVG